MEYRHERHYAYNITIMNNLRDNWRKIRVYRRYLNELDQMELLAWERWEKNKNKKNGVLAYDLQTRLFEAKKIYTMLYGDTTMDYEELAYTRDQIDQAQQKQGFTSISEDRRF